MELHQPGAFGAAPLPLPPATAMSADGLWRWDGSQWVPNAPASSRPFRPVRAAARWAVLGLVLSGLAQLVGLGALTGRLSIVNRMATGESVSFTEATSSDDVVRASAFIELAVLVICAITFLVWLHRVVANNQTLGARGLRFGPGVAVGWWFIPIANLYMPFRVVAEAWRAADPQHPGSTPPERAAKRLPRVLAAWWSTLILGSLAARFAALGRTHDTLDGLRSSTMLFMAASALLVLSAMLAILVVTSLTARQQAQRDGLAARAGAVST
jgi:hypothetical protein